MRSIYSRGLNFHGQCGLGKNVAYSLEKFTKIPDFPCQIKKVSTNIGHTLALDEGKHIA